MPLYGGSVTQTDLAVATAAMTALIPAASSTIPPGIGVAGATGNTSSSFARSDHTHASSVQRARLQVTSGGIVTWTFPNSYGVVPIVTCTVETPSGSAQPYLGVLVGTPTLTSATFGVFKAMPTTLGSTLIALAGLVINPFATVPSGVYLDCWAALPTQ